jgi:hypothetical protein
MMMMMIGVTFGNLDLIAYDAVQAAKAGPVRCGEPAVANWYIDSTTSIFWIQF